MKKPMSKSAEAQKLLEDFDKVFTSKYQTELAPEAAEQVGTSDEGALSKDEAVDTNQDWTDEEPCFLEDDGVFLEPPTFITRARGNKARDV